MSVRITIAEREERQARVLELRKSGLTLMAIAKLIGCTDATIRRDLDPGEGERNRQRARDWRAIPGNAEREIATKTAYRKANPELWLARRRASMKRFNAAHRQEIRNENNAKRERLRAQIIEHYGCRCNCPGCHVVHAVLLTADHVNGDGAAYRRIKKSRSTRDFYARIVRNNFPNDIQLLCGSCNLAKSNKKACPLAGQDH